MFCQKIGEELYGICDEDPFDPLRSLLSFARTMAVCFSELHEFKNDKIHSDAVNITSDKSKPLARGNNDNGIS